MHRFIEEKGRDAKSHAAIGAAMAVHCNLGCGFLESVYQEALGLELSDRAIPFRAEVPLAIRYRGQVLRQTYRVDFVCFDSLILELKALARLSGTEEAQVPNYLKISGLKTALLLNFGAPSLQIKRISL